MKKLKLLVLIALNTFLLNGYSQTDELSFELTKLDDNFKKIMPKKIFKIRGETIIWIDEIKNLMDQMSGKTTSFIHKYDKDLKLIKKGQLDFDYKLNNYLIDVFSMNDKIYCLLGETSEGNYKYFVSEINLTDFSLSAKVKIHETQWKRNALDGSRAVEYGVVSENHLVFYRTQFDKNLKQEKEFVGCYDSSFNKIIGMEQEDINNKVRVKGLKGEYEGIIFKQLADKKGRLCFLMGTFDISTQELTLYIKK